jgi:hypothetical protein
MNVFISDDLNSLTRRIVFFDTLLDTGCTGNTSKGTMRLVSEFRASKLTACKPLILPEHFPSNKQWIQSTIDWTQKVTLQVERP